MKKITAKFNAHILIVDDYLINLELTKHMLELMQCKVDTAESAYEAMEKLSQNDYDMIFMDIQMPDMDGVEALNQIREQGRTEIPVIALTANAIEGDREKYLACGMSDYLAKPITGEKLEDILRRNLKAKNMSLES